MVAGCSQTLEYKGILTMDQVLEIDSEADAFEWNDNVYKTGIGWIEEVELSIGEQIGEIFEDKATHLHEGTKIYSANERSEILIVKENGEEKRYLLMAGE